MIDNENVNDALYDFLITLIPQHFDLTLFISS